jgi:DNA replication and repair protein RecF
VHLDELWLSDFRCYETAELKVAPGVTLIRGDNGAGKTSLLESVCWLASGKSFRAVPDSALVRQGQERAIIRAGIHAAGRPQLVEAEIANAGRHRVLVNGQRVPRLRDLATVVRVTVFSPDDLALVKGGPVFRREYLDDVLCALAPRYIAAISDYDRVLRHRNALLRNPRHDETDDATRAVFDDQLVTAGSEIVRGRLKLLDRLGGHLTQAYDDVAGSGVVVTGVYASEWLPPDAPPDAIDTMFRDAVASQRRREQERGVTLVGPHRDDWRLSIGGLDSRTYASQGEQRSLALALRLASHRVVSDVVGEAPVLLLDDVFSELDPHRAAALVTHLPEGQALLTTAGTVPDGLAVDRVLCAAGGEVRDAA